MIKNKVEKNKNIDINTDKLNKLKEIFPSCFNRNGEFDITVFQDEIKDATSIIKEGYGLNFLGKNYAKYIASLDTETILVPDEKNNGKDENKNSENIYISGDNIDALKHLVKSYSGKIKCIYIDPPYNTGSDGFVYNDKFNLNVEKLVDILDVNEEEAKRICNMTNAKSNSHSAWLTFMYPRLYLAKQLLKNDGVIFISIDDNEQSQLKLLSDNIFGEENYIATISRLMKSGGNKGEYFSPNIDYVLVYSKDKNLLAPFREELGEKLINNIYNKTDDNGNYYREMGLYQAGLDVRPNQRYYIQCPDGSFVIPKGNSFPKKVCQCEKVVPKSGDGVWRWVPERYIEELKKGNIIFKKTKTSSLLDEKGRKSEWNIYTKILLNDRQETGRVPVNYIGDCENRKSSLELKELQIPFDFAKPTDMLVKLINFVKFNEDDIILDFFSGSASTAHSVLKLNSDKNYIGNSRRFIMVQINEKCSNTSEAYEKGYKTIDEIGQERIRRAAKKIKEETNANIDYGFKHYIIKDVNTNTLDKLEKFEPNYVISDGSILDEFGINAVLTTWINEDGYGLTDKYEKLELEDYTAYKCQNTIYLLNWNISDLFIKALIEKYEKEENFDCNRIVMFGYSFTLNEIQTLKDNLQQVKNIKGINVEVITRY